MTTNRSYFAAARGSTAGARRALTGLALTLLGVLAGCTDSPTSLQDRQLKSALERWDARPFTDYSFDIRVNCTCPSSGDWLRMDVVGGVLVDDGIDGPDYTVDDLFEGLRTRELDEGFPISSVVARFDGTLGFPISLQLQYNVPVGSAPTFITLRNVTALDP